MNPFVDRLAADAASGVQGQFREVVEILAGSRVGSQYPAVAWLAEWEVHFIGPFSNTTFTCPAPTERTTPQRYDQDVAQLREFLVNAIQTHLANSN